MASLMRLSIHSLEVLIFIFLYKIWCFWGYTPRGNYCWINTHVSPMMIHGIELSYDMCLFAMFLWLGSKNMCRRYYDMQGPIWAGIYLQYRGRSLRALLGGILCTAASCLRRSSSTSSFFRRPSSTSSRGSSLSSTPTSTISLQKNGFLCTLVSCMRKWSSPSLHSPSALGWISLHCKVRENTASTFFGIPLDQSNQYELKRLISKHS